MTRRRFPADDPERRLWQDPDRILSSIGLREGDVFVDIGCGEGFFALPAARRIGKAGRVFALDINSDAIARIREQAESEGLSQVSAEIKEAEAAVVCEGCADIVFFGNDLHDFSDPGRVIRNAHMMLKPSGRLVNLDWKPISMNFGPPLEKRFSVARAKNLIESGGLKILSAQDAGPYHYLIQAGK
jgi:ubiquinone/menaquinone biosynthesis C-methylase UbiE